MGSQGFRLGLVPEQFAELGTALERPRGPREVDERPDQFALAAGEFSHAERFASEFADEGFEGLAVGVILVDLEPAGVHVGALQALEQAAHGKGFRAGAAKPRGGVLEHGHGFRDGRRCFPGVQNGQDGFLGFVEHPPLGVGNVAEAEGFQIAAGLINLREGIRGGEQLCIHDGMRGEGAGGVLDESTCRISDEARAERCGGEEREDRCVHVRP